MGRISTKLNLAAFAGAAIIKSGKNKDVDCIIIPIEMNGFFKSEKGAVYADLIGFDVTNPKEGQKDTHLVKQSFPKDKLDKMTDEQKKAMPILGNHIVWDQTSGHAAETGAKSVASEDDLPF